jgi:hypothetical protein
MGVRYPGRMFLANPGTGVAGSLSSESVDITVEYTIEGGEPITQSYESNRIIYEVQGTVDSPKLVYEHGLIISDYGDASATRDEQSLIIGDEIFIPVLTGNLTSLSSMELESIDIKPLSQSYDCTDVQSVTITVDTGYPEVWEDFFGEASTEDATASSDDFESGGWGGGDGWLGGWLYSEGWDAFVTNWGTPYEGTYHLWLLGSTGYAQREVDLSEALSARLQFWAKADSFDSASEKAYCRISPNGTDWTTVYTWTDAGEGGDGVDDNIYHFCDIDLSPYELSSTFWIYFDADMNVDYWGDLDSLYVDDLEIVGTYTVDGGDGGVQIDPDEGEIVITSTDIRQITFPAGDVTADALYAGMISFSTTSASESAFLIGGGTGTNTLHSTQTRYVPMFDAGRSGTESDVQQPMPAAGTVSNFYVILDGSPGSHNSYTFIVRKNGEDTTVACTISDSDTEGSDLTNSVDFNAGDYISIMVTPASNPTARSMRWTAKFSPD